MANSSADRNRKVAALLKPENRISPVQRVSHGEFTRFVGASFAPKKPKTTLAATIASTGKRKS